MDRYIGTIIQNEKHTPDVSVLKITFSGIENFNHIPGQFVMISIDGINNEKGIPAKRAYSIASSPSSNDHMEICIKKEGIFSTALYNLAIGSKINIEGPFGKFNLGDSKDKNIVFIAGGTGIAPLISMIRYLIHTTNYRHIDLIYSVKTKDGIIYNEELKTLSKEKNFKLHLFLTREEGGQGRITKESLNKILNGNDYDVYMCGKNEMIAEMIKNLEELGFDRERLHKEVW